MSPATSNPYATLSPALVLVIDDDQVLSQAMSSLLRSAGHVVQAFTNPLEMLSHPASPSAACVILDVRLQGFNGLDVPAQMSRSGLEVPVVFITGYGDIPMSVRAMKAGAVDFLAKPFRHQDLLDSVEQAVARHREGMEKRHRLAELDGRLNSLTPRERQVMIGVVDGLLNKQIAGNLEISEVTVKMHRAAAMRKMCVKRVADLIKAGQMLKLSQAPARF